MHDSIIEASKKTNANFVSKLAFRGGSPGRARTYNNSVNSRAENGRSLSFFLLYVIAFIRFPCDLFVILVSWIGLHFSCDPDQRLKNKWTFRNSLQFPHLTRAMNCLANQPIIRYNSPRFLSGDFPNAPHSQEVFYGTGIQSPSRNADARLFSSVHSGADSNLLFYAILFMAIVSFYRCGDFVLTISTAFFYLFSVSLLL